MKLWPFCLFVSCSENLLTPHHRWYARGIFLWSNNLLTSFQVVKSHPETTLGSHYHPVVGSRAQLAKEPDALGLHAGAGAGTSKGEWKHQPRDQPLCTSSLSWNKSFTLWIPPYLQKAIPVTIWGGWDLLQNSWGKSTEIKIKTNQDLIPLEAQWGVCTHVITLFFPFFSD